MAEQDWAEAGVPSSERTHVRSRLTNPTNAKISVKDKYRYTLL